MAYLPKDMAGISGMSILVRWLFTLELTPVSIERNLRLKFMSEGSGGQALARPFIGS